MLPELLADLNTGHNIVATVFEECRSTYRAHGPVEMRPVGEVEFVAGIAAMSASGGYGPIKAAQGIVGYADLALGDRVEPVLEALIRAGVARLAAHGLVLDAWCYHPQLADVIALARAVPQATIVMCHVGGVLGYGAYAGKKDEVHAAWRASMAELTTCPNVFVKLGGMLNRGAALNFRELPEPPNSAAWAAAWPPYVEPCIGLFGAERCSFESNFPVDKMGTGYATLWNAFKRITAGCSPAEKLALHSGTASDFSRPSFGWRITCEISYFRALVRDMRRDSATYRNVSASVSSRNPTHMSAHGRPNRPRTWATNLPRGSNLLVRGEGGKVRKR